MSKCYVSVKAQKISQRSNTYLTTLQHRILWQLCNNYSNTNAVTMQVNLLLFR